MCHVKKISMSNKKMEQKERHCHLILLRRKQLMICLMRTQALNLSLGLRAYSPRVELFRNQFQREVNADGVCCAALTPYGIATSVKQLEELIPQNSSISATANTNPELTQLDHISGDPDFGDASPLPQFVLYASPGTRCFQDMHRPLKVLLADHSSLGGWD